MHAPLPAEHYLDSAMQALASGDVCHSLLDRLPVPIYTTDAEGAFYHILRRFHLRMIEGLALPLYVFPTLAFFLGWIVSVLDKTPEDPKKQSEMEVRSLTGIGAEKAVSH